MCNLLCEQIKNIYIYIYTHTDQPRHTVELDNTAILTTEPRWFERGVKEAIYIRALNPSLSRDGGRYNLPPVLDHGPDIETLPPLGDFCRHIFLKTMDFELPKSDCLQEIRWCVWLWIAFEDRYPLENSKIQR